MPLSSCDLCDTHQDRLADGRLQILEPVYRSYGRHARFAGAAVTLKLFEDNTLVRSSLEQAGGDRVLVIDGGGSTRCALVGGNLAELGARNEWAGIIVFGCVRDRIELDAAAIGIRALGLHPRKSDKHGTGTSNVPLHFSSVRIRPGDWIYADEDGVLIAAGGELPG